jgi:hypothetical protein
MNKSYLILTSIGIILIISTIFFVINDRKNDSIINQKNITEIKKEENETAEELKKFDPQESSYYQKICKASFNNNYQICGDLVLEDFYINLEERKNKEEDLNNMKIDCILKSTLINSLMEDSDEVCDQIPQIINNINITIITPQISKFLVDKCHAEFRGNLSFYESVDDYDIKDPAVIEHIRNNKLKITMINNTLKYYQEKDERFCSEKFSHFGPYCKAILNKDPSLCD